MRKIVFILLVLMISCVSVSKVPEGRFYKTKSYAGRYENITVIDEKFSMVETTHGVFKIKANPSIPDSSLCYIRIEYPSYDFHPDIERQMMGYYLTWNGTEFEYKIYNAYNLYKLTK